MASLNWLAYKEFIMNLSPDELTIQLSELNRFIEKQKKIVAEASRAILKAQKDFKETELQLANSFKGKSRPEITDHAIVRYIERILKFNISKIKDDILPKNIWELTIPDTRSVYKMHIKNNKEEEYDIVIRDGKVTTLHLPDEENGG
jgi:hypothetical protein